MICPAAEKKKTAAEEPEKDGGYVKLVNARYDEKRNLTEVPDRTGMWAWKHYHKANNTTTYQPMQSFIPGNWNRNRFYLPCYK